MLYTQNTLLKLISISQFGNKIDFSDEFSWNDIFEEAKIQSVVGIVATEAISLATDSAIWQEALYRQIAFYLRYSYAEEELIKQFENELIEFVVLKGNSAAVFYKDPSKRAMGDIDILVKPECFEQAKQILINNQYKELPNSEKHTRHNEFIKNGIVVELHRRFSYEDIDLDDYIWDGFNSIQIGTIEDHTFPMLPKLANGLVLLGHMREHLKGGLGLRQVIDWMMYVYRELDDEFWGNEFSKVAKEKGMEALAIVTTRMCQIYLGLPDTINWCKGADEKVCEELMENILSSGNFGRKQGSGNSVEFVSTQMKRQGRLRWLQKMGEYNWEAYHRHHWLKPFCWIYQGTRYIKKGFSTGRNKQQLSGDFERSKKRYELLKKLGIE